MKKLFLIALTGIFALALTACQSSESVNQNVSTADASQNSVVEETASLKQKTMMKESSPDAVNAPFDLQFLDTMIEHHQNAVDMAKPIVEKTDNAELKTFAAKIIADQDKEIGQMKTWREKWFKGKPAAMNTEMPGMSDSMRGMNLRKLDAPASKVLDMRFLDMMTKHHQGAITMSNEAVKKAEHSEVKTLASRIIKAQEAEIKRMQNWKTAWSQ